MNVEEKKKRIAWRIARASFVSGAVFSSDVIKPEECAVSVAISIVEGLARFGCLDDKYGDGGSYEIGLAEKAVSMCGFMDMCARCSSEDQIALWIFDMVRDIISFGVGADEKETMRTIEYDREKKEIFRREEEMKERIKREEDEKDKIDRIEKMKRVNEIEADIAKIERGL